MKDYGIGIDPELLYQFNRSGGGAGIGLAGMRERLRELGGRLEVESEANGTLICAVIPTLASNPAKKSEKSGNQEAQPKGPSKDETPPTVATAKAKGRT